MPYHWLIYGILVLILAKTETFYGWSQDILLLKRTECQLSLFDKMPMVPRSLHACLTFWFRSCPLNRMKVWKKDDKEAAYRFHTNKYRSLLATLWCHAFLNKYAEIEMPHWSSSLVVIISIEVWFVEINRLVCKESNLIELKYMAFYYVTTCFKCVKISLTEYLFLSMQSMMSVWKRARFLSLNQISDLVWVSESYEVWALSDRSSEDVRGFEDEPGPSHWQLDWPTSRGQASNNSFSSNAFDAEEIFQSEPGQQVQTLSTSQWIRPSGPHRSVVHTFRGGPRGQEVNETPHINDGSSPLSILLLHFAEIITLLVMETKRYYHNHLDRLEGGPTPLRDMTKAEMLVFLVIMIHMGQTDRLLGNNHQFHTHF